MLAYTRFPNFCCLCMRPDPRGTLKVTAQDTKHLGNGRMEVTAAAVDVPLCGRCRWDLRLRCVVTAVGGVAVGALAFLWWLWDSRFDADSLPYGGGFALVVAFVAFLVLSILTKAGKQVARLQPDGTDLRFFNTEYQALYTGESKPQGQGQVDWRQVPWR